jgi:cytochrome c oxidase subunit IV
MAAFRPLILVWVVLLGLLVLTLGASFLLAGLPSAAASLAVALAKAALIFWFFMHLKEESGLIRLIAIGAGAWLLILLTLTAADYTTRSMIR